MNHKIPANVNVFPQVSRRAMLQSTCLGFGWLAAQDLLRRDVEAAGDHAAKARSVIMLTMVGGPSQMDLFDPKPELTRSAGKKAPETYETLQPGSEKHELMGTPFKFRQHGECGMTFSSLLPQLASISDDLCMIRSMHSANNNHPQAQRFLHSGKIVPGWPTFGSWISYAIGSENNSLPAFVVLRDPKGYTDGGSHHWTNGWLPAIHGGTEIRSEGTPVLNLHPARPVAAEVRRRNLELLRNLNELRRERYPADTRLESRIQNYELAARMQNSAERVLDVSQETPATLAAYGVDRPETADFGRRCLMARRMVEVGVRFVEVMTPVQHGPSPFDSHNELKNGLEKICPLVDGPSSALIQDLKQRGLLDSTIVIWTGEFGRLPISQNGNGRDHNRNAFTLLAAGGGFRAGHIHGETDELGYRSVTDRVSCHDLHATILHQLGIDHTNLGHPHNGRDERLTDPEVTGARVISELLA